MLEFLDAVKHEGATTSIPFLCCRLLPSVLPKHSWERMTAVCKSAGAVDYIDVPDLEAKGGFNGAVFELKNVAMKCIESSSGA
jgi:hypothetical protein